MVTFNRNVTNYQMVNPMKLHKVPQTTIFLWFSYNFPIATIDDDSCSPALLHTLAENVRTWVRTGALARRRVAKLSRNCRWFTAVKLTYPPAVKPGNGKGTVHQ